jgi:agmatine deiminase
MPAEWEPHRATWLSWPRPEGISFPGRYHHVLPTLIEFARCLSEVEEVHINVWDAATEEDLLERFAKSRVVLANVHFHPFRAYEPWCRDHGPIFLVRESASQRERAIVDWGYNAWGGKYPPFELDDAVPAHIAALRHLPLFQPGIVMEGGSIDVNGSGTLLTTESCLLNPNRNPDLTREDLEAWLGAYLGVTRILWLGDGIVGDDTDGHVDDLTRFVGTSTVVTCVEDDPADANYEPLRANLERLRGMRDEAGRPLRILALPMPGVIERDGQRLPASYANFYIANRIVIAPVYGHPNDARALDILRQALPDRRVIGIDSTELIWGLGSFHCLSQQEPR